MTTAQTGNGASLWTSDNKCQIWLGLWVRKFPEIFHRRRSPIPVLTGPDVEQLCWYVQRRYRYATPPLTYSFAGRAVTALVASDQFQCNLQTHLFDLWQHSVDTVAAEFYEIAINGVFQKRPNFVFCITLAWNRSIQIISGTRSLEETWHKNVLTLPCEIQNLFLLVRWAKSTPGWVAVWRSGNVIGRINKVTLRQARLVLGWVTVFGRQTTLLFHQATQANSASYPQRDGKWVLPAIVRWCSAAGE